MWKALTPLIVLGVLFVIALTVWAIQNRTSEKSQQLRDLKKEVLTLRNTLAKVERTAVENIDIYPAMASIIIRDVAEHRTKEIE